MIRLPDLLATRRGRLGAFFFLYVAEGIPTGFMAIAVITQLRRTGVGPAEIGALLAAFYAPWTLKWMLGPLVDALRSRRFGHRRAWILLAQVMMATTLVVLATVPTTHLGLFAAVLIVHNAFGALQTVAVSGLAVSTLHPEERGTANGWMLAGMTVGQSLGGSGVLMIMDHIGFRPSFVAVALAMLCAAAFVVLPLKEPADNALPTEGTGLKGALREMRSFVVDAFQSLIGTRGAFAAIFYMLLPAGATSLGFTLPSSLGVELGLSNKELGSLQLMIAAIITPATIVGGWLADRMGRRRMLALYTAMMSLPTLWLMLQLQAHDHVMPRAPGGMATAALVHALWIATAVYSVAAGLMVGTRFSVVMDVTNPRVAGSQFTAYLSLMNVGIAFSVAWQGRAVEALGYPNMLLIDGVFGLVGLLVLTLLRPVPHEQFDKGDGRASIRLRASAIGLAMVCLAWLPFNHMQGSFGAMKPVISTVFTVAFIAAALLLYVATLHEDSPRAVRAERWLALALVAMYGRYYVSDLARAIGSSPIAAERVVGIVLDAVSLLAAAALIRLARSHAGSDTRAGVHVRDSSRAA